MEMLFLIKGVILGFSIAAPVGPIGVLCIRRTLSSGMLYGLVSGLGTATADALYGLLAAFGVTVVSGFLLDNQMYLRLVGGSFLIYLGYAAFRTEPATHGSDMGGAGLIGGYTSAFALTLANPMTILSFAAVFAGLGVGETGGNNILAAIMVLGVFIGSATWWLVLSGTTNYLRYAFDYHRLKYINQLAGIIIMGFGLICLITR